MPHGRLADTKPYRSKCKVLSFENIIEKYVPSAARALLQVHGTRFVAVPKGAPIAEYCPEAKGDEGANDAEAFYYIEGNTVYAREPFIGPVIIHECGHAISNALMGGKQTPDVVLTEYAMALADTDQKTATVLLMALHEQIDGPPPTDCGLDLSKFITPYASRTPDEFMAECFRAYCGASWAEGMPTTGWQNATPERLRELHPGMAEWFDYLFGRCPEAPRCDGFQWNPATPGEIREQRALVAKCDREFNASHLSFVADAAGFMGAHLAAESLLWAAAHLASMLGFGTLGAVLVRDERPKAPARFQKLTLGQEPNPIPACDVCGAEADELCAKGCPGEATRGARPCSNCGALVFDGGARHFNCRPRCDVCHLPAHEPLSCGMAALARLEGKRLARERFQPFHLGGGEVWSAILTGASMVYLAVKAGQGPEPSTRDRKPLTVAELRARLADRGDPLHTLVKYALTCCVLASLWVANDHALGILGVLTYVGSDEYSRL